MYIITGSTGDVICLAGDSAGGNLVLSVALRAASYGIRVPDGIMAAYTPTLIHYTPTPSRMLALMDPLLPVGILVRCMAGKIILLHVMQWLVPRKLVGTVQRNLVPY